MSLMCDRCINGEGENEVKLTKASSDLVGFLSEVPLQPRVFLW